MVLYCICHGSRLLPRRGPETPPKSFFPRYSHSTIFLGTHATRRAFISSALCPIDVRVSPSPNPRSESESDLLGQPQSPTDLATWWDGGMEWPSQARVHSSHFHNGRD